MISFRQSVLNLLLEGQELSEAEIFLVNEEIEKFSKDFLEATGKEPKPIFGDLILIAHRLEAYGFYLPRVERWVETDIAGVMEYEEKRKKGKEVF